MLNDNEKDLIINILKNDNPYLYLGAGFSYGAKNKDDVKIPDGQKMKEIVLQAIRSKDEDIFEEEKSHDLPTVCQALKDLDVDFYLTTIIESLTGFFPLEYHAYITDYKWNSIFTVNIDDIVEQVYKENSLQVFVKKANKDNVVEKKQKLFKLHGCVRHREDGIVFSRKEYIDAMTSSSDFRLLKLVTALSSNSFFVVGTEMKEDELEYFKSIYEKSGDELMGHKVVFINPSPAKTFRNFIRKHDNFSLIECTAEEFLSFVHGNISDLRKGYYSFKNIQKRYGLCSLAVIREKTSQKNETSSYKTKLYFGEAPVWNDLFYDFIIGYSQIFETEQNLITNDKKRIFVIHGALYSGKTSFLMKLFFDISAAKNTLCLYNTGAEFSVSYIKGLLQSVTDNDIEKIYLFCDDAGENYTEFKKALDLDPRIIIVATSYELIHQRKRYALDNDLTTFIPLNNHLTEQDILVIKEKLSEKGLEGELIGKDVFEWKKRISLNENIVSALYNVTHGLDFQRRFSQIIGSDEKILHETNYKLIVIAAMCYKLGIPHIRPEMLIEEHITVTRQLTDEYCDYLTTTESGAIKIKSLFIADAILANNKDKDNLKSFIVNICISIASNVQEHGMNYHKKVYEYLTKYKYLKILQLSNNDINSIYDQLQKFYADKSYYWLQVGLVEQDEQEFDYALMHFKSARTINPHSYGIIHAIARNYCKQAQNLSNKVQSKEYFAQGEQMFLELIENKDYASSKSYAIHSLICETIHYYQMYNMQFPKEKISLYKKLLSEAMKKDGLDEIMISLNEKFSKFLNSSLQKDRDVFYNEYENNLDY